MFNVEKWNMSLAFQFEKLLRVWVYTLEKLFKIDETQINGVVITCDLSQLIILQSEILHTAMLMKSINFFSGKNILCNLYVFTCILLVKL